MKVLWEERAWEEYLEWQIKNNFTGWWSRRIDEANRIVYREKDEAVIIASCKGHYEN